MHKGSIVAHRRTRPDLTIIDEVRHLTIAHTKTHWRWDRRNCYSFGKVDDQSFLPVSRETANFICQVDIGIDSDQTAQGLCVDVVGGPSALERLYKFE
jgi:hypothetical protein